MRDKEFINNMISTFEKVKRVPFHGIKVLFYDEEEGGDQIYQIRIWHGIDELSDTYSLECKVRKSDIKRVGIEVFVSKMYENFLRLSFMKKILV